LSNLLPGRVDIDDRTETIGKRIRTAEREWVPMIIIIGDREIGADTLPVRMRTQKDLVQMSIQDIKSFFTDNMKNNAYRSLNLPKFMSQRPIFRG
jgi:threonyl-tRNA synthetase